MWLVSLAFTTLVPALVYASTVPDHRQFLTKCGELKVPAEKTGSLIRMRTARATQPALFFEDPLCPTCKAFHQRLIGEDVFDKLDVQLALFPLDNSCNWMLDTPLHPGGKARRWVVEQAHALHDRFRRLVVNWEKTISSRYAFLCLASALMAYRR